MDRHEAAFVHVLLFECPQCGNPLSAHRVVRDGNLEQVDGASFELTCECDWKGARPGIRARKHWVENWL